MPHETKDVPLLPIYHHISRSSSPTPSSPTHPPPLYSLYRAPTPFPAVAASHSAKRKSLDPSPKDRSRNRRKASICIAVAVVVLLVLPLSVFGGILHATRRNAECMEGNTGFLEGAGGCGT
ncbi:uncharacterized protein K444DRAFT_668983 [Hyaloscypha bicolor E]|uniref:Uncharacterized protein n=1 Tax=Hyaloscypha bicolor E TaxID=1095630 RepID=A0A2J6SJS5_9HELO|nr:uncharacterized protein K444DRAFT_668983 [Hyaloscypha bicolor E]PMD51019.1 hypothetical protein K444DRAFT_668983 [Hyaloscypha bicolor E]